MSNQAFSLRKPETNSALFIPSDSIIHGDNKRVVNISTERLRHYHNHPFKLYEGERLADMIESIEANGILIPLLIRLLPNGDYEVLAGHNRLESGKIAGLSEVPCIIVDNLTDEEAHLIVTESNLVQRSFADLSHSERAEALANHYDAIKRQGKRTDLIKQVEAILNIEDCENPETTNEEGSSPVGNKSIEVTGAKYGLSKNSVARYIRINKLIKGFKDMIDGEKLPIRAGVSLSFIRSERQVLIFQQFTHFGNDTSISMKQADKLRQLDSSIAPDSDPNDEAFLLGCGDILIGKVPDYPLPPKKIISLKIDRSVVTSYFKEDDTEETIQEKILEALQFYQQHKDKISDVQDF